MFCSVRRDGKSLGQMAKDEISGVAGFAALFAVLSIVTIIIAVVGLVVVNALKSSPWGFFTIAMTIPIAFLMGIYMRYIRVGHAIEASLLGFVLVMASVVGGRYISESHALAPYFTYSAIGLAWMIVLVRLCLLGYPCVAPPGSPRSAEHFCEARNDISAGRRDPGGPANATDAAADEIHRWHRTHLRRQDLSFLLHNHRLWSSLRVPFPDLFGHYAKNAE